MPSPSCSRLWGIALAELWPRLSGLARPAGGRAGPAGRGALGAPAGADGGARGRPLRAPRQPGLGAQHGAVGGGHGAARGAADRLGRGGTRARPLARPGPDGGHHERARDPLFPRPVRRDLQPLAPVRAPGASRLRARPAHRPAGDRLGRFHGPAHGLRAPGPGRLAFEPLGGHGPAAAGRGRADRRSAPGPSTCRRRPGSSPMSGSTRRAHRPIAQACRVRSSRAFGLVPRRPWPQLWRVFG